MTLEMFAFSFQDKGHFQQDIFLEFSSLQPLSFIFLGIKVITARMLADHLTSFYFDIPKNDKGLFQNRRWIISFKKSMDYFI